MKRGAGGRFRKLTPEEREAYRQVKLEEARARIAQEEQIDLSRKCKDCKKIKPLTREFWYGATRHLPSGHTRWYADSVCKPCKVERGRKRRAEDPEWVEKRRAYVREYVKRPGVEERIREQTREASAIRRRKQGIPVRGAYVRHRNQGDRTGFDPTEVAALLERERVRFNEDTHPQAARAVRRLKEVAVVELRALDEIFHAAGRPDLLAQLEPIAA